MGSASHGLGMTGHWCSHRARLVMRVREDEVTAAAVRRSLKRQGPFPAPVTTAVRCIPAPSGTVFTQRADQLYLHLLHWPFGHVHLPDMAGKVGFARFLHDGSEVRRSEIDPEQQAMNTIPGGQPPGTLTLNLPTAQPPVAVPVIELFLTEE